MTLLTPFQLEVFLLQTPTLWERTPPKVWQKKRKKQQKERLTSFLLYLVIDYRACILLSLYRAVSCMGAHDFLPMKQKELSLFFPSRLILYIFQIFQTYPFSIYISHFSPTDELPFSTSVLFYLNLANIIVSSLSCLIQIIIRAIRCGY